MTGVLNSNDPFYMTFGKDGWTAAQSNLTKQQPNEGTTKKKTIKIFEHDRSSDRARRSSQITRAKTSAMNGLYKQNIDNNMQTARRVKPHGSMTDREAKQSLDFGAIRQQVAQKYSNIKQHQSARKYPNLFDLELSKKLNYMETVTKTRTDKTRNQNDNRKPDSFYQPQSVLDKYRLIQTDPSKKTSKFSALNPTINPTINRYKEEMTKLDNLISRVNARINTSTVKNGIEHKRYAFQKA